MDNICKEWDKKSEKESHEGKLLEKHIEEVKDISLRFLNFYDDFPKIFYEIADYLAEYHDYGKLCKDWNVKNKEKRLPPHSPRSVQWLEKNKKVFDPKIEWTYILWYLIMKHHSKLTDIIGVQEYKLLADEVRIRLKKFDTRDKINLIDVFGLFKIADILSADNRQKFNLKRPSVSEERVKSIIGKPFDENIWKQQLELQRLQNIGILRAPTGWGKTTASLLYFLNKPVKKIFFLLPTITAINKFHGKLSSNLSGEVTKYFYYYDAELSEENEQLNELFFSENFMSPYIITTIDQFLLTFLQYGKYHTKRVMFRDAGLVFDEIHLLNPLMLGLVGYFLNRYAAYYNLKALLMSATLPDALSQFLMQELNVPKQSFLDYTDEYCKRRRVELSYETHALTKDIDLILKQFEAKKKVLIILNTVDRAIETARLLREYLSQEDVILIHSRMMYQDRKNKEEQIDKKKEHPHILVSTQISEVSLDISYHFLYTELSPLASLFQRFGRVNRYGKYVDEVNVCLYETETDNGFCYPYESREIDLARSIVKEVEGDRLRNEGQLLDLFNQQYSYDLLEKEVNDAMKKVDLEAFDDIFGFFSLDVYQDRLMNVLNYRDAFSMLVVPDPCCVTENTLRKDIINLLSQPLYTMDFAKRRSVIAKIKNVSLPVPAWWLKEEKRTHENAPFPVIQFKSRKYDRYYGLTRDEAL